MLADLTCHRTRTDIESSEAAACNQVKVENDRAAKGQIRLWTQSVDILCACNGCTIARQPRRECVRVCVFVQGEREQVHKRRLWCTTARCLRNEATIETVAARARSTCAERAGSGEHTRDRSLLCARARSTRGAFASDRRGVYIVWSVLLDISSVRLHPTRITLGDSNVCIKIIFQKTKQCNMLYRVRQLVLINF